MGVLSEVCNADDYLGIDIDEDVLKDARKRYPYFHFYDRISETETEKFETIVLIAVIEHVPDPSALLLKFKRMLKQEGRIVLTTPHPTFE